ncbi:hypothetical protein I7I51_02295 [Histoplasma capsulatum]|uniref:Uncharacterized protein n=1 Tax=Ajellomyces capsulatus TaxID=5037 RepID=A0A8A1MEI6_AJECA|nr:hypothetical protein I7I51_02295 [Histoplasma capsulatum]
MLFPRLQLQDGSAAELLEIIMMTEATTERQIKRSTDLEEAFMGVELAVRLAPDHGTLDLSTTSAVLFVGECNFNYSRSWQRQEEVNENVTPGKCGFSLPYSVQADEGKE